MAKVLLHSQSCILLAFRYCYLSAFPFLINEFMNIFLTVLSQLVNGQKILVIPPIISSAAQSPHPRTDNVTEPNSPHVLVNPMRFGKTAFLKAILHSTGNQENT
jgi:hypothetical protein